ncbi:Csu type fimbrial protein [Psychrobacter fjordensis]|uniref:Csu type fimbrial protein n=1 Tax=Psychrobacter fjordensis TaxID=664424 RepID=UPI00191A70F3|nr:spore coat protein U domain-containing protein [Psychrobacter fjordensis]
MKLRQWHYGLLLLPIVLWLSINSAHADITCTASMNTGTVNISNTITPSNANNAQITGTLTYSCTNNALSERYASVCLGVDGGDYNSAILHPRYMTGPNGSKLAFTMTLPNGALWGNDNDSVYKPNSFLIPPNTTVTGHVVINVSLLPNFGNTVASQGVYSSDFSGNHTTLTYQSHIDQTTSDCETSPYEQRDFPFKVQATVINECKINTTSDIILGSRPASATSFIGSNNRAIDMTCTSGALYNIGLAPSNGDVVGRGVMIDTGSKNYQLPYQLLSNSSGRTWGNNGSTYATLTNGVTGEGNGTAQLHTVYVTVPNSDVKPASYSDTVTVHVNY